MPSRPVPTTPLLPQVPQNERHVIRWAGDLTRALFLVLGDLARRANESALADDLTAVVSDLATLEGRVTTAEEDITTLEGDVSGLESSLNVFEGQFTGTYPGDFYDEGTWTPVFTFSTPGDVSVAYNAQNGQYTRVGRLVFLTFEIDATVTYTTASGTAFIDGNPFTGIDGIGERDVGDFNRFNGIELPAGYSWATLNLAGGANRLFIRANGSDISGTTITHAQIPSGTAILLRAAIIFHAQA